MVLGSTSLGSTHLGGVLGNALSGAGVFLPFNPNLMQQVVEAAEVKFNEGRYIQIEVSNSRGRIGVKGAGVGLRGGDRTYNAKS